MRRVLALALPVLVYFGGSLLWLRAQKGRAVEAGFSPGSSLDTTPRGLSLAYAYLAGRAPGAERMREAVDPRRLPSDATVLRVRPVLAGPSARRDGEGARGSDGPPRGLTPAEERWVAEGGRLVVALDEVRAPAAARRTAAAAVRKVHPLWPGVDHLQPAVWRGLSGPALLETHALFVAGESAVLTRRVIGRGEVLFLAFPEAIENARLGQSDHLALLVALAGGRRVYFDETAHGLQDEAGLFDLLTGWGLGPFLVVLGLLAAASVWRARARLGPPDADPGDRRSEAVDLVESLGALYHRSLAPDAALDLYRASLARAVSLRTGLRGAALQRKVADLAGPLPPRSMRSLEGTEFRSRLHRLNDAFRRLTHAHPR